MLLEWSDARTAALFLKPCTPKNLNEELGQYITRENGNRPGARSARYGGWWYHKHDLERVRAIMDALGCTPLRAAQLFGQMKVLREREMLPYLLEELSANSQQEAAQRRRFQ